MKAAALLLVCCFSSQVLADEAVRPEKQYFPCKRSVRGPQSPAAQACIALDAVVFAHASPGLGDVRLYSGQGSGGSQGEVPYLLHVAGPQAVHPALLPLLNLGVLGGKVPSGKGSAHTVFDVAMPRGPYRNVELAVSAQDFIASVTVYGSQSTGADGKGEARILIGTYTIFDLTRQKLGRSTVLHLPESDFRSLHFEVAGDAAGLLVPEAFTGVSVLQFAESQPRYVTVSESNAVTTASGRSVLHFSVPARVPVDRVAFVVGPSPAMFSRDVRVEVKPVLKQAPPEDAFVASPASFSGTLLRVHQVEEGRPIDEERLDVETRGSALGAASGDPADDATTPEMSQWTVTVENGDDTPLAITSARLEMAERSICFAPTAGTDYTLFYGDPALSAPRYDYASLATIKPDAVTLVAGEEQKNPAFHARPNTRPLTERYPALLWLALLAVLALLGGIALKTARQKENAS